MRVIMDLKIGMGKYHIVEVDNATFGAGQIAFVFGYKIEGGMLYIFDIPDDGTEIYNYFSNQALEKGILDLRGYTYRMYNASTMEEIFDEE